MYFVCVLVNNYGVLSMDVVFKKYFGKGKWVVVKVEWLSIEMVIEWIYDVGG